MVTIQRLAEVYDDINKIEEFDDETEEKQIGKARQIMKRRVKFDVSELENIGSIECLYDSERIKQEQEKETIKSEKRTDINIDTDTFSRDQESLAVNAGTTFLDNMMKSGMKFGQTIDDVRRKTTIDTDTVYGNTITEKMIDEENNEDRILVK